MRQIVYIGIDKDNITCKYFNTKTCHKPQISPDDTTEINKFSHTDFYPKFLGGGRKEQRFLKYYV